MKWWVRIKDLKGHRWLPFYLPIIGTILYIVLVLIAVPSQFGDKSESESADAEKAATDKGAPPASSAKRARRPGPRPPAAATGSPANP